MLRKSILSEIILIIIAAEIVQFKRNVSLVSKVFDTSSI